MKNEQEIVKPTDKNWDEKWKEFENQFEKEHNVFCPFCNTKQSEELMCGCVTYWGDGEDKEVSCEECGKDFMVKEIVNRTFEVIKKEVSADVK